MHPLKAWVGLSIVKRKEEEGNFIGWVSVDVGLKQVKVISRGEDGGWK